MANPFPTPGFETASAEWTFGDGASRTDLLAHAGSWSAWLRRAYFPPTNTRGYARVSIGVTPGLLRRFTFWVFRNETTVVGLTLRVTDDDGTHLLWTGTQVGIALQTWTQVSVDYEPVGSSLLFSWRATTGNASANWFLDDVDSEELEEMPKQTDIRTAIKTAVEALAPATVDSVHYGIFLTRETEGNKSIFWRRIATERRSLGLHETLVTDVYQFACVIDSVSTVTDEETAEGELETITEAIRRALHDDQTLGGLTYLSPEPEHPAVMFTEQEPELEPEAIARDQYVEFMLCRVVHGELLEGG